MDIQDDQNQLQPTPSFIPAPGGPEAAGFGGQSVESIVPVEISYTNVEKQPAAEVQHTPTPPKQAQVEEPEPLKVTYNIEPKKEVNVVDKSKDVPKLHKLTNPLNELTARADKEEDEFISNVEHKHGH